MRHWHIAQTTLFWLIFSHTLAVIYFVDVVPLWLYGLSFIAIGWRLAVYLGSAIAPPRYLVVLIAIAAGILLALLSSGYNTMELLIQLMLVGYGLKFLELRQRRDVYVLVLLGYFVIAVALVVHQGMGATAWLALVMIFNTCALMTLQRPGLKSLGAIREVLRLLVISLPLTLVLFFAMPRVTQLWQMPQLSRADTGLSDSMAPGEFNSLSRDPSLAFRVTFEGPVPPRKQLYWRAIVLENYDGQRWQQDPGMAYWEEEGGTFGVTPVLPKGAPLNYEVIAEASYQRWLFGLQVPVSRSGEVGNTSDYRLIAEQSLTSRFMYQAQSYPEAARGLRLTRGEYRRNLALPDVSPRARAMALALQAQGGGPQALAQRILAHFNRQPFRYTLKPPLLIGDSVDQFMFETRAGFCAHYASAFTLMMRAAGIPARVVIGYQGGEWNEEVGYLSVYQYDAHAWSEIWIPQQGWVRFDPTAAVAPERVERGLAAAIGDEETFLEQTPFSLARYRDNWLLNQVRTTMDNVDYFWSRWLLGYNAAQQQRLLSLLLGDIKQWKVSMMLGGCFAVVALWLLLTSGLRLRSQQPLSQRLYQAACDKLASAGCERQAWEGPLDFAQRVEREQPAKAETFAQFSALYIAQRYQTGPPPAGHLRQMKKLLRRL